MWGGVGSNSQIDCTKMGLVHWAFATWKRLTCTVWIDLTPRRSEWWPSLIAFTPTHQNAEMNKPELELLPLFPLLLTLQGQRNEQLFFFFFFFCCCCCFSRTLSACDVPVSSLVESRFWGYCDGSQVRGTAISSPSALYARCCYSWTRFQCGECVTSCLVNLKK